MKKFTTFVLSRLGAGVLLLAPIYLASLLVLKAMKSLMGVLGPIEHLLPKSLPADEILSLSLVLAICFFVGLAIRTPTGRATWERIESSAFRKMPGYSIFRSLTQRLAGGGRDTAWKPVLVETGDGLVPGFIIEELEDGRFTVFVPSIPTPFAGAVYIVTPDRVHPVNVPFTQAIQAVSRWGEGSKDLVAAMEKPPRKAPLHAVQQLR